MFVTVNIKLREYQIEALKIIKDKWEAGVKGVCLWAPTGSGKGVILSYLLEEAARAGQRAIFVVRGRNLVGQGSRRLSCPHGVLMANHRQFDPKSSIQVCSIDTMRSRKSWPPADIVVIDEIHFAGADSYIELASHYPDARILGVSATPYTEKPLTHLCQEIVQTCSIQSLIDQGHLVPPRYFAPNRPSLAQVHKTGGEFKEDELEEIMIRPKLVGDVVKHYIAKGQGRPCLCFAVSVKHSTALAEEFAWNGVSSAHMDATTPDDVRQRIFEEHRTGSVQVIVNVGVCTTGIDLPWCSCISVARPTMSLILNDQMLGRGTRPAPGKSDFVILDHAGNINRHGFITDEREATLTGTGKKGKSKDGDEAVKTCPNCFAVCPRNETECPECGFEFGGDKKRTIITEDGELVEVLAQERKPIDSLVAAIKLKDKWVRIAVVNNLKRGFVWHKLKEKLSDDIVRKIWPWSPAVEVTWKDLG
jgi:DNA repair protein RadD